MKEPARFIKPALYVSALCGTVVLFSLPLVLYYTARYTDFGSPSVEKQQTSTLSVKNKTLTLGENNETSCISVTQWGISDTSTDVVCEPYSGNVCLQYLMEWQECIPTLNGGNPGSLNIAIDSGKSQLEREQDILQIQEVLELYGFNDCSDVAIPMLCHYYFPLMATNDCSNSQQASSSPVYTITQEDCYNIDNTVCAIPWLIANSIESIKNSLPDCSTLPNKNDNQMMNDSIDSFFEDNATLFSNITCRDDFILINQACFPRCDQFKDHPHAVGRSNCQLIGAVIAVLFSVIAFILSVTNRKVMFRFPSFFLVLLVLSIFIGGMTILIQAFDNGKRVIMCPSVNLLEALSRPTPYCIFSGAVFHYVFAVLLMWWFLHTCVFFYFVKFPFHAARMKKLGKTNKIAAVLVIIGLIVPFPGVIISFSLNKYGYRMFSFPPEGCVPAAHAGIWLYSVVYPFTIIGSIGGCLLISVFWIIHKNQIGGAGQNKAEKLTTAEKKLIVALLCYIVFGTYSNSVFALKTGHGHRVFAGYYEYFLCELSGHVPGKCDRSGFERHQYPIVTAIGYIFFPMVPMGVIIFIVNWDKLWKSTKDWFKSSTKYQNFHLPT